MSLRCHLWRLVVDIKGCVVRQHGSKHSWMDRWTVHSYPAQVCVVELIYSTSYDCIMSHMNVIPSAAQWSAGWACTQHTHVQFSLLSVWSLTVMMMMILM